MYKRLADSKAGDQSGAVVGAILALINHYDAILARELMGTQVLQIIITYLVPFSVATYSAACYAKHIATLEAKHYHEKSAPGKMVIH